MVFFFFPKENILSQIEKASFPERRITAIAPVPAGVASAVIVSVVFGIIAIGKYWKWYRFSSKKTNQYKPHKPKSSWGNKDYMEEDMSPVISYQSQIYDISVDNYDRYFKVLSDEIKKVLGVKVN